MSETPHGEEPPCPITGRPYFMHIEHPDLGDVPTYGGPFDSYTTPAIDEEGEIRCERYDHDAGDWIEGGEPTGLIAVNETEYTRFQSERDEAVRTMTSYYDRIQKLEQRELELASLLGRAVYYVRFHKTAAACGLDDEIKAAFPTAK